MMARSVVLMLAALLTPGAARWCQVENVKSDIHGNYSYMGAWRIDGCSTLSLDHGYCGDVDCPWRVKFTDEAIIQLADTLHGNTALTALSIGSNEISDEGVIAIAEALRDNEVLIELTLSGNMIGNAGVAALADALKANPVLTNLNIEYNQLTDEGARALLNLLKSDESALETLHIDNNKISAELLAAVVEQNQVAFRPPEGHGSEGAAPALGSGKDEM